MALKNCPSCGGQISDNAHVCPQCGCQIEPINNMAEQKKYGASKPTNVSKNKIAWYVVCAIVVLGVIGYFAYDKFCLEPIRVAEAVAAENERLEEEFQERQRLEAEKKAKERLERFKKFQTDDLACFMLHGRVKTMTESYGPDFSSTYYFNEDGALYKVIKKDQQELNNHIRIDHRDGKLILTYGYQDTGEYVLDDDKRLIKEEYYTHDMTDLSNYFDFDSNGWPLRMHGYFSFISQEEETNATYEYTDIDEYGNWRSNGKCTRTIEYYPVENF